VRNQSGGEDSFTLGQGGFVLGGLLVPDKMFYFISAEGQLLNATREVSFAVPTVDQRGVSGSTATGLLNDPLTGTSFLGRRVFFPRFFFTPTTSQGNAIFSLFPFPNNPTGIYGLNTLTQVLPANGQGKVISGKVDSAFSLLERQQSFTARYNFTDDWREIPAVGGAIFSTIRPRVRTQNFSTFLNSEVTTPNSRQPVFNQIRVSYGRTRLNFEEVRDTTFLLPSDGLERLRVLLDSRFGASQYASLSRSEPFLLNAPLLANIT